MPNPSTAHTPEPDMLELAQQRVIERLNAENPEYAKAIDPTMWVGILSTILEIIRDCQKRRQGTAAQKNAATAESLRRVGLVQKLKLRDSMIKKVGRKAWRDNAREIHLQFVAVSESATDDERLQLVQQICN